MVTHPAVPAGSALGQQATLTSGSPVSWLVWIRILPRRMSLHTAVRACSMVSPARRMDTPVIWARDENTFAAIVQGKQPLPWAPDAPALREGGTSPAEQLVSTGTDPRSHQVFPVGADPRWGRCVLVGRKGPGRLTLCLWNRFPSYIVPWGVSTVTDCRKERRRDCGQSWVPTWPGGSGGGDVAVAAPEEQSLTFSGRKERACSINSLMRRLE